MSQKKLIAAAILLFTVGAACTLPFTIQSADNLVATAAAQTVQAWQTQNAPIQTQQPTWTALADPDPLSHLYTARAGKTGCTADCHPAALQPGRFCQRNHTGWNQIRSGYGIHQILAPEKHRHLHLESQTINWCFSTAAR